MKLKLLYPLSIIGVFLGGFGGGWVALSQILSLPMDNLSIVGVTMATVGLAIMIYTLSTIRKIDLIIEDEKK